MPRRIGWLCRIGLHRWKKPRRLGGFLVRFCSGCPAKQEQDMPSGRWKTVAVPKRVRRKKLHVQTAAGEEMRDFTKGLGPL